MPGKQAIALAALVVTGGCTRPGTVSDGARTPPGDQARPDTRPQADGGLDMEWARERWRRQDERRARDARRNAFGDRVRNRASGGTR